MNRIVRAVFVLRSISSQMRVIFPVVDEEDLLMQILRKFLVLLMIFSSKKEIKEISPAKLQLLKIIFNPIMT